MKLQFTLFFLCLAMPLMAQTTVTGTVRDNQKQPIPGVNVTLVNSTQGTATDFEGNFSLTIDQPPPFQLKISGLGFISQTIEIISNNQIVNSILQEDETKLDEIVISASRTPERIFESPVSVERFDSRDIKNTASADFYGGLENLKGVDMNTNSLTFKSINTRGFATFSNTRFMQLVDGIDNSSPALNFVLGNLLGMTDLDVNSIELLPGASSALYGANAFNGILFMTSKNPFDHQGISAYAKSGLTSQDAAGEHVFYDFGVRVAHAFSDKFAAKANFSYLKGTDWYAVSDVDVLNPGSTRVNPNYDGLNIYGDEVSTNIRGVGQALANAGLIPEAAVNVLPNENVSRTGYAERDLTNYNAESVKFDAALHYRPFADDFEVIYLAKIGVGSTIYQGSNRYALKDFFLQQHKLEFKNENFFLRGYITAEKAGDSYDTRFAAININRAWKPDNQWFGEYAGAFLQATLNGAPPAQAHAAARQFADTGRLLPGSAQFENTFNQVVSDPDLNSGAKFQDETQLYHADANYNFSHLTSDIADIQVGGSFREYKLNSFGTIFTDTDGPIRYSEYGVYTQVQKKLLDERLKLTGSVRFDKSELFEGQFTPRFSLGYTAGAERNHNLRASVQTAFRNPTTQDLFIGLDAGRAILVGSAESNLDRDVRTFALSGNGRNLTGQESVTVTGRQAYENAFSLNSVNQGTPAKAQVDLVKPEKAVVFELGYRGQLNTLTLEASGYYNIYTDFISNATTLVPYYGEAGDNSLSLLALQNGDFRPYQTYTNSGADVKSYGVLLSASLQVFNKLNVEANYTFSKQDFDQASDPDFRTSFNTPEHRFKASVGSTRLVEDFGFKASYRWSDTYFWQSTFADGQVPAYSVVDAQINYIVPSLKATLKAGASNLLGKDYYTAFGTGYIGSQYYISLTINNL